MTWLIYLSMSVVFITAVRILQGYMAKNIGMDLKILSIVIQLASGVAILIYGLFVGIDFTGIEQFTWNAILSIFMTAVGTVFLFRAYSKADVSIVTILFSTASLWAILTSFIVFKESLLIMQFVGISLILIAVFVSIYNGKRFSFTQGELYALASAFIIGIMTVNETYIARSVNVNSYLMIPFLGSGLLLFLYYRPGIKQFVNEINLKILFILIVMGILNGLSIVFLLQAITTGGNVSRVSPLSQISVVLVVVVSSLIYRDHTRIWFKVIASVLAMLGVYLLV